MATAKMTTNGVLDDLEIKVVRKTRSDCTVGTFEKKLGLPKGTLRNTDGRKTRKDKTIGAIRREAKKQR